MPRVGARDDHEVRAQAVLRHGLHLGRHVFERNQILAIQMAAALRKHLILQVQCRGTGSLVGHHRAHAALHLAVARVGIGDHRQPACIGDLADGAANLRHGEQADVGEAGHVGGGASRHVQRLKAGLRDRARHQCVEGAGGMHHALLHGFAKTLSGVLRGHLVVSLMKM